MRNLGRSESKPANSAMTSRFRRVSATTNRKWSTGSSRRLALPCRSAACRSVSRLSNSTPVRSPAPSIRASHARNSGRSANRGSATSALPRRGGPTLSRSRSRRGAWPASRSLAPFGYVRAERSSPTTAAISHASRIERLGSFSFSSCQILSPDIATLRPSSVWLMPARRRARALRTRARKECAAHVCDRAS